MFKNLFRGAAAMNATTKFEKARIQATYYGDTSAPNESDLQTLLKTLSGADPEMKANTAISTIIGKLKVSQSRKYWNYIMKNLVILDRAIEEGYFVDELSRLEIPEVEEYKAKQKRHKEKMIEDLVASYFKFIKDKADIYGRSKFSLNVPKDKRKMYFKVMNPEDVLAENRDLTELTNSAFEVFNTGASGHLKYTLNQYVFLLVLSSIMNILSTQYVAFIAIVEDFFEMDSYLANESLLAFKGFLKSTEDLITFTGNHQFIPGFQISLHELRNPAADTKLLNSMQEYIKILDSENMSQSNVAVARQSLKMDRPQLEPKRSEINIALVAEQFKCERVVSDDEDDANMSPPPLNSEKSGDNFFSGEQSGIGRSQLEHSHLKKTYTTEFEKTLQPGFQAMVSVEKNAANDVMNEYKRNKEEVPTEEQQQVGNETTTDEHNKDDASNITPVFKKLLMDEEERVPYDVFNNYFSDSSEEGVWVTGVYHHPHGAKISKEYFELKPLALVMTEFNTMSTSQKDMFTVVDYKDDIFNSFKNFYSPEFRS